MEGTNAPLHPMFSHQFISQQNNLIICVTSPIIVLAFLSAIIYDNPWALPQINFSRKRIKAIYYPIPKFGTVYLQMSKFALGKNRNECLWSAHSLSVSYDQFFVYRLT